METKIKALASPFEGIHIQEITLREPFLDFASRFTSMAGTVLLMSGGDLDCARQHILAARPWLTFTCRGTDMTVTTADGILSFKGHPFETLRTLLDIFRLDHPTPSLPVASGLFGYLSYDLKDHLEDLPRTTMDDLHLPQICLFLYLLYIIK